MSYMWADFFVMNHEERNMQEARGGELYAVSHTYKAVVHFPHACQHIIAGRTTAASTVSCLIIF